MLFRSFQTAETATKELDSVSRKRISTNSREKRQNRMAIPQHTIDQILDRTDIVDLIGQRVKLKKTGRTYSGCCPFHQEKSPSFHVFVLPRDCSWGAESDLGS